MLISALSYAEETTKIITFEWDKTTDVTIKGYHIYRSTESGKYDKYLNSKMIVGETYTDEVMIPLQQTLYYTIVATNGIIDSDKSNEVKLEKPMTPTNLGIRTFIKIENSEVIINNN